MYAVIKTSGKQYRVENEQKFLVDRLNVDEGSNVVLNDVLMVVDSGVIKTGEALEKLAVSATVLKQTRGPKIITLKHRRRKNSRRVKGHRQDLTLLKVIGIGDPLKLVTKKSNTKVGKNDSKSPSKLVAKEIKKSIDSSQGIKNLKKNEKVDKVVKKVSTKKDASKIKEKSKK